MAMLATVALVATVAREAVLATVPTVAAMTMIASMAPMSMMSLTMVGSMAGVTLVAPVVPVASVDPVVLNFGYFSHFLRKGQLQQFLSGLDVYIISSTNGKVPIPIKMRYKTSLYG
jgi:hypothetical protein